MVDVHVRHSAMDPNALLDSLLRLFTDPPWVCLTWPAIAMVVGTIAGAARKSVASTLGIVPRSPEGLVGVVTAPFIHTNFAHFTANLPPFLVLGALMLRAGVAPFIENALFILVIEGLLVWMFARRAAHVGMSGVVFGFLGYIIVFAVRNATPTNVAIAGGVLLFYGGMLAGVTPARKATSWEGHLFGLLVGATKAWIGPL